MISPFSPFHHFTISPFHHFAISTLRQFSNWEKYALQKRIRGISGKLKILNQYK
ncbi:hypothetical protein [Plasmodium yoelii yoelii]|uniref:Uncharacterized protein n=1 Tax=Plasmodium yoelii yoelii TaxID=73239 RepID=Q7RJ12_PLAYO|nr:hypothetical protein [Plasmodium yoelii yoelii]